MHHVQIYIAPYESADKGPLPGLLAERAHFIVNKGMVGNDKVQARTGRFPDTLSCHVKSDKDASDPAAGRTELQPYPVMGQGVMRRGKLFTYSYYVLDKQR